MSGRVTLDRRAFLRGAGAGAAGLGGLDAIVAARQAPAFARGEPLHVVRWNDFIPEADAVLRRQMVDAGRALGARIVLETINANDLQPRITAAIQSGAGADVFHMFYNWPQLYRTALVDVSDVADAVAKAQGGFYGVYAPSARVGGKWLAMPHSIVGNAVAYRKSWLHETGTREFPKTWDELRRVGAELKRRGRPYGQTLGHTFGDAPTFTYSLLWGFGGAETDRTGRRVVLASPATVDSVRFMQALWRDACDPGGLAWDDTNNNRAFHAGEIWATLNGASIYILAKRQPDRIRDDHGQPMWPDIDHAPLPAGPAGQFPLYLNMQHGVMRYSRNQALAKDFLRWLHARSNYQDWFEACGGYSVAATTEWERHPMWARIDKPLQVFRTAARETRIFGHAGPASSKATEVFSKYVVTDMYANAVQGKSADEAVAWADRELRKIYGA
jgi:multiple sugar transport system substrate-binding protein